MSPFVAQLLIEALVGVRSMIMQHVSVDRGHEHSSGSSVVSIWISAAIASASFVHSIAASSESAIAVDGSYERTSGEVPFIIDVARAVAPSLMTAPFSHSLAPCSAQPAVVDGNVGSALVVVEALGSSIGVSSTRANSPGTP